MANDSPRSRFLLLLLLLHTCVFVVVVVACVFFWGDVVVACVCFIVGFVCVVCEFLHFLSSIIT